MIKLEGVIKSYRLGDITIPVLRGISFEIEAGEFVAIMGPSGSGKSTLLNVIGCLDAVDHGAYQLLGKPIRGTSDDDLARIRNRHIGFIFQLFNLIPRIDSIRNVQLPMVYGRAPRADRIPRAHELLRRVGLADRAHHSPGQLSGGQQQRVAIARALVNDPDVLIADEPTGSLDSVSSHEIMALFCELNESGKTIVMVTHEEEIARHATRIIRLRDGLIAKDERT
jgi:putative ABC transport system ATP-binding protein